MLDASNRRFICRTKGLQCIPLIKLDCTRSISEKLIFLSAHKGDQKLLGPTNDCITYANQFSTQFDKDSWSKILIKAEKVVGYPTSFLNLRYLVSDEVAHFAQLLRKLMKTKHPLIKMARRFILSSDKAESKRSLQVNGLIVLLISKAVGQPASQSRSFFNSDVSDGIHSSQRCLAEIAEMIFMGTIIHRGILDLKTVESADIKDMNQGNKLAVLCGDYLLANACNNLAKLKNTQVVDLMSLVISDISEGIFRKSTGLTFLKEWLDNIYSNSSSLLANSARSAMLLVDHPLSLQDTAFEFAMHLDISHKIWLEFVTYKNDKRHINKRNSLFGAIYHDRYRVSEECEDVDDSQEYIDDHRFNENLLGDVRVLFDNHYNLALKNLQSLEVKAENSDTNAIETLRSILNAMKNTI